MTKIIKITASDTYELRSKVLRPNQELSTCYFDKDNDEKTFHFGATDGLKVLSIGSFIASSESEIQIRGMATHPDFRRQGLAQKILNEAERRAKEKGFLSLWCNAREVAIGFYRQNGYEIEGLFFEIPLIGKHIIMRKNL